MQAPTEARGHKPMFGVFLKYFSNLIFTTGSLSKPRVPRLANVAGQ